MRTLLIALFFILPVIAISQTADEIKKEANPEYQQTVDNSDYAKLLKDLTEAKKSGNQVLFNKYLDELNTKYAGNSNVIKTNPLPENRDYFVATMKQPVEVGYMPDWANGENRIYGRYIGTSSIGNPRSYSRMVKIQNDTLGNLYVGMLTSGKDTLMYFRSTNQGNTWSLVQAIAAGFAHYYYNFDFALADTAGGFKIGMTVSIAPNSTPFAGTVYYADMLPDGSNFSSSTIWTPTSGRGLVGVTICTDAYSYLPGSTYWYIAASNLDASTGVTSFVPVAYSPNWGGTWVQDTARNSFNDYELDIDYNFGADSIYVLLTNNLSTTNENLRLRYTALSNWGTNVSWKQFNPANTSDPEFEGSLAVNRKTNAMAVSYTVSMSSNENIYYSYAADGSNWTTGVPIVTLANNENRSTLHGAVQQTGAFRIAFCSEAPGLDTVFYMSTGNISTGFVSKTPVSRVNLTTGVLAPSVVGFVYGSGITAGAVIYAGNGPTNLWYNSSNLLTGLEPISQITPEVYTLNQNYPNPFNPTTSIKFSIPKDEFVSLKVYDMLGKEVATLVNQNTNAGEYEVSFGAAKLTSGVYFYKLTSGNFSDVKKMILVK